MNLFKGLFGKKSDREEILQQRQVEPRFIPDDPDFIEDPYSYFDALREVSPVYRSDSGAWVLTSYNFVEAALNDPRLGNAPSKYATVGIRNKDRYTCANVANNLIAFMDAPRHGDPRRIISRAFHRYMRAGLPDLNEIASHSLSHLKINQPIEFITEFATPYSLSVVSKIFGIPSEDELRLKIWTNTFFYLFTQIPSVAIRNRLDQSLQEFRSYLGDQVRDRRKEPRGDFLSELITMNDSEESLTETELIDNALLVLADGVENVDSGIANMLVCMIQNPEIYQGLNDSPDSVSRAVNECLRFESPAQFIGRVALEDIEIGGYQIKENEPIFLVLAAANRDPEYYSDRNSFKTTRSNQTHLSFGRGKHSCLGGALVKMQMEAALSEISRKYKVIRSLEDRFAWQFRLGHRWLDRLKIEFES